MPLMIFAKGQYTKIVAILVDVQHIKEDIGKLIKEYMLLNPPILIYLVKLLSQFHK